MKIAFFTFNRAEYNKLELLLNKVYKDSFFEPYLIVGGSHLLSEFGKTINDINIKIHTVINTIVSGENSTVMAESVGLSIIKISHILENIKPDCVIIHGDRFDVSGVALSCSLMNIFMVHIEGGELTGTIDDNLRHSISKLSHCHLVSTELSKKRLILMGEHPNTVHVVGCPLYDKILNLDNDSSLLNSIGYNNVSLIPKKYIICMYHPVVNDIKNCMNDYEYMMKSLVDFTKNNLDIKIVYFYPNIDYGSKELISYLRKNKLESNTSFIFLKNLKLEQYMTVLKNSCLIIGNSSSGIRESGIYGIPSIVIGKRQKNREYGKNVTYIEHLNNSDYLNNIIEREYIKEYDPEYIYGDGKSVQKIIDILKNLDTTNIIKTFYHTLN